LLFIGAAVTVVVAIVLAIRIVCGYDIDAFDDSNML